MLELIQRLRERRVFRGASYYIVASWLLLQVGSTVFEPMGLPQWSMTALLYLLVCGFPLAVFLSWRFDFNFDHGLVRAHDHLDAEIGEDLLKVRSVDYLLVIALLAITGVVVWQTFVVAQHQAGQVEDAAPVAFSDIPAGSIAVLPFANLSESESTGFLGDGITDTVTHVLSRVDGIKVIARTSAFYYKDKSLPVQEIAEALQVAHILEGSVQEAGGKVRIIARLIHAVSGVEVWSKYFDRESSAIFDVQDEIAQEVVTALKVKVLGGEDIELARTYQPDVRAFERFILGRAALDKGTLDGAVTAYALFEEAIEIDPKYAHAYIMLGRATISRGPLNLGVSRAEWLERAGELSAKALALDPLLPEAHIAQAQQLTAYKQFNEAELAAERALALSPSHPQAYAALRAIYATRAEVDKALNAAQTAVSLDPEDNKLQMSLALSLWAVGRSELAIATIKKVIEREPEVPGHYTLLARYLRQMGRSGEAMYWDDRYSSLNPGSAGAHFLTCLGVLQLWNTEAALRCVRDHLEDYPDDVEATQYLAVLTEDVELALQNLEPEVAANPTYWYRKMQLAEWLNFAGRHEAVIAISRDTFAGLYALQPVVNDQNIWMARSVAEALIGVGDEERAQVLIAAGLTHLDQQRKLQGAGIASGIDDVLFLALRGDYQEAFERLSTAIDRDWQFYSFGMLFPQGWPRDFYSDPRFKTQLARQAEKMAVQRAWYAENRERDVLYGY